MLPSAKASTSSQIAMASHDKVKQIKFRNYIPYDKSLKKWVDDSSNHKQLLEKLSKTDGKSVITEELNRIDKNEINIVPKKPNHDLKRQVQSRLDKLKRKTQRVLISVIQEKLANEA